MSGYVLAFDAEFDLDEIWEYIAADSIEADVQIEKPDGSKNCSTHSKPWGEHRAWGTGAKTSRLIRSCSGRSELT